MIITSDGKATRELAEERHHAGALERDGNSRLMSDVTGIRRAGREVDIERDRATKCSVAGRRDGKSSERRQTAAAVQATASQTTEQRSCRCQQRVVTPGRRSKDDWTACKQVVVPRGAVVTPAVRDLLRQTKIALAFDATGNKNRQSRDAG